MAGEFATTITVPANTPHASFVSVLTSVQKRFITSLEVYFPTGCAGLCYVAIFLNDIQVMPDLVSGSGEWYHGEGSINFIGHKAIRGSEGRTSISLEIRAYNLDDTYDHHPIVRLDTSEV